MVVVVVFISPIALGETGPGWSAALRSAGRWPGLAAMRDFPDLCRPGYQLDRGDEGGVGCL